ncbi:MAG: OadG family protein [Treponema sp.]
MTILEMLKQSGILTLLGMGVVFAFLVVMILCMNFSSKIIIFFNRNKKDKNNEQ